MKRIAELWRVILKTFRDDAAQYRFSVALRMVGNLLLTIVFCAFLLHLFIKINILYFEANGFPRLDVMREAFMDYVYGQASSHILFLVGFLLFYFFLGIYIAELTMRPFRLVADHCQAMIDKKDVSYNPGFYSDLQLMTNFCDFFFNASKTMEMNKDLIPVSIPERYKNIHRPVFERSFYLHYSTFIMISSLITVTALFFIASDMYESVITLAVSYLKQKNLSDSFLVGQAELYTSAITIALIVHFFLAFLLTIRIHSQVATPAFAIFSTLRSYLKGQYHARVHLIGSYFLRPECRVLNQYLDYLEENYSDKG